MKKLLAILVAMALAVSLLSVTVLAAEVTASGTCGENLTWELSEDGVLTISGTGEMEDYWWGYAPWFDYREKITTVIIEDGVTGIGDCAFPSCDNLTDVTIPDSVTSIGVNAFRACHNLTSVTIPDGLTDIGNCAFLGCPALADEQGFVIVNGILFQNIEDLKEVVIPDGVTKIGAEAFSGSFIISVTIPDSVTSIGDWAFQYCDLTSLTIPDGLTDIGDMAFFGCPGLADEQGFVIVNGILFEHYDEEAEAVVIPDGVTRIGVQAFAGHYNMTSVTIPDSVTSIGTWAFWSSNLTSVVIPDSVVSIGEQAFFQSFNMTSVVIGSGVKEIGAKAFANSPALTSITVGSADVALGDYPFGLSVFQGDEEEGLEPEVIEGTVIYGLEGSTVQAYAEEYGIPFVTIDGFEIVDGQAYHTYTVDPETSETTYEWESGESVIIHASGELEDFVRLLVDGKEVDPSNYTLTEGSTIVTISGAFLDTLSAGEHTVTLEFTNGEAMAKITVLSGESTNPSTDPTTEPTAPSEETDPTSPQTGDNVELALCVGLIMVFALCGVVVSTYGRKRTY